MIKLTLYDAKKLSGVALIKTSLNIVHEKELYRTILRLIDNQG